MLGAVAVQAAEVIPPAPKAYFNDYAQVVSPAVATELNQRFHSEIARMSRAALAFARGHAFEDTFQRRVDQLIELAAAR